MKRNNEQEAINFTKGSSVNNRQSQFTRNFNFYLYSPPFIHEK